MHKLLLVLCFATVVQCWSMGAGWYECCCPADYECQDPCYTCRRREHVCNCDSCNCYEEPDKGTPKIRMDNRDPKTQNEFLSMLLRNGYGKRFYPY